MTYLDLLDYEFEITGFNLTYEINLPDLSPNIGWFDNEYCYGMSWQYCLLYYLAIYDYYNGLNLKARKTFLKLSTDYMLLDIEIFKDKNIINKLIKHCETRCYCYKFMYLLEKYK